MSGGEQRPSVGVFVIHGIGEQDRGEMLEKLGNGLRRIFPELPGKLVEGEAVALGDHSVRFYEIYWADLLQGERVKGTFDMEELRSLAWFPLLNQLGGAYDKEPYPLRTVLWWTIILPLTGFAVLLMYWGARLIPQLLKVPKSRLASPLSEKRSGDRGRSFMERARNSAEEAVRVQSAIDKLLDEYLADVLNYVNSAGDMFRGNREVPEHLRRVYGDVLDRFYDQLLRARSDGCQSIQIIAHSLGTVVMYHALRGLRIDEAARPDKEAITEAMGSIEHLYTIGSPLEKIRFFWPRLRSEHNLVGERKVAWDNFVSYFDPVAGELRRHAEWGDVENHHLLGGGFLTGHVVYEHSPAFLQTFSRGLLGKPRTLHRTTEQKFKDLAILLGETLFAPVGLVILVSVGAALWILMALLVPFLVSLPFRLVYGPETWGPILDYGATFFGMMFLFVFSIVPWIRARQAFARLWGKGSPVGSGVRSNHS